MGGGAVSVMVSGQGGGGEEPALAEDIIDSLMLVDGMFAPAAPVPPVAPDTQVPPPLHSECVDAINSTGVRKGGRVLRRRESRSRNAIIRRRT